MASEIPQEAWNTSNAARLAYMSHLPMSWKGPIESAWDAGVEWAFTHLVGSVSGGRPLIPVRFDLVCGSGLSDDRLLEHVRLPAVPLRGEGVNIGGDPYVVVERGWATDKREDGSDSLFAYLRVSPLQAGQGYPGETS